MGKTGAFYFFFLLASRFLSVGASEKNICGMQKREGETGREKKSQKNRQTPLAPKCCVSLPVVRCLQWGGTQCIALESTFPDLVKHSVVIGNRLQKQVGAHL